MGFLGVDGLERCTALRRVICSGEALTGAQVQRFGDSEALDACPKLRDRSAGRCSAVCVPVSIMGRTVGMLKLLFHRETLEVLGVHCFGTNASEIIHIGQAIMMQPGPANTLMYFINTTFNYPTMAEAYRVAALNGYNRLF